MSDNSKIEWTEASWPVTVGCTHISEGCDHCYAAALTSGRLKHLPEYAGLAEHGRFNGTVRCLPERLDWPLKWRKPRRIFVCSMSDLFHESVPDQFIACVFAVMAKAPQHTFQVLTKRHGRLRSLLNSDAFHVMAFSAAAARGWDLEGSLWPLPNVWIGVSVEDQKWADVRVPALIETPAAVRFLSCEPLLGPVDLDRYLWLHGPSTAGPFYDYAGRRRFGGGIGGQMLSAVKARDLHWVIIGGESGPGAREMDLFWARSLISRCQDADVAVFMKQVGSVAAAKELSPLADRKGGNWDHWPPDLCVREFPRSAQANVRGGAA